MSASVHIANMCLLTHYSNRPYQGRQPAKNERKLVLVMATMPPCHHAFVRTRFPVGRKRLLAKLYHHAEHSLSPIRVRIEVISPVFSPSPVIGAPNDQQLMSKLSSTGNFTLLVFFGRLNSFSLLLRNLHIIGIIRLRNPDQNTFTQLARPATCCYYVDIQHPHSHRASLTT